jgi:mRNA deadenylase 3'-5' endonuclease subunit Ccr4
VKEQKFTLMHWNVMSDFRGKDFYVKDIATSELSWAKRLPTIVKKIIEVSPDIFGVCDIDAGKNYAAFKKEMTKHGYAEFSKENKTLQQAIYYKKAKFDLVNSSHYNFEERQDEANNQSDNENVSNISFDGT